MADQKDSYIPPTIYKRITRKDIAERLGVSVSVVSRALNNSGYVKKEIRESILSLAEQLHYIPNPIAMTLQQRKTRQIMFVCKDLHNSFNIDLYYGMLSIAEKRGYMVFLNGKLDFQLFRETLIDGIILANNMAAYEYDRQCGKTITCLRSARDSATITRCQKQCLSWSGICIKEWKWRLLISGKEDTEKSLMPVPIPI